MTIGLFLSLCVMASPFDDGVRLMQDAKLDEAIETWRPLAEEPRSSAEVHYNLGVAYYRQNKHSLAIYHWRVAHLKRPRNTDVVHNLALARARSHGTPRPSSAPVGWMDFLTLGELGGLSTLLTVSASIGAWRSRRLLPWIGLALAGFVGTIALFHGQAALQNHPTAVLIADTPLRDVASIDAMPQSTLRAGAELRVRRTLGEFILVEPSQSASGWLPISAVKRVEIDR